MENVTRENVSESIENMIGRRTRDAFKLNKKTFVAEFSEDAPILALLAFNRKKLRDGTVLKIHRSKQKFTVNENFDHVERKFNVREKQEAHQRFPQIKQREEVWQSEVKEIGNVNEGGEPPKGGDAGAKRTAKTRGRSATRAANPPPTLPVPRLPPPPYPPPPLPKTTNSPQMPIQCYAGYSPPP